MSAHGRYRAKLLSAMQHDGQSNYASLIATIDELHSLCYAIIGLVWSIMFAVARCMTYRALDVYYISSLTKYVSITTETDGINILQHFSGLFVPQSGDLFQKITQPDTWKMKGGVQVGEGYDRGYLKLLGIPSVVPS